jgi:hypothetical protein
MDWSVRSWSRDLTFFHRSFSASGRLHLEHRGYPQAGKSLGSSMLARASNNAWVRESRDNSHPYTFFTPTYSFEVIITGKAKQMSSLCPHISRMPGDEGGDFSSSFKSNIEAAYHMTKCLLGRSARLSAFPSSLILDCLAAKSSDSTPTNLRKSFKISFPKPRL